MFLIEQNIINLNVFMNNSYFVQAIDGVGKPARKAYVVRVVELPDDGLNAAVAAVFNNQK